MAERELIWNFSRVPFLFEKRDLLLDKSNFIINLGKYF